MEQESRDYQKVMADLIQRRLSQMEPLLPDVSLIEEFVLAEMKLAEDEMLPVQSNKLQMILLDKFMKKWGYVWREGSGSYEEITVGDLAPEAQKEVEKFWDDLTAITSPTESPLKRAMNFFGLGSLLPKKSQ